MCDCQSIRPDSRKHASAADFCHIFTRDLKCFYKLAFLLTGNHTAAGQCVLAALGNALEQHDNVHLQSAHSWSKLAVIKWAVQIVFADLPSSSKSRENWEAEECWSPASSIINAVTRMAPLERFLYVLTVLERFSDRECSILLGYALEDLAAARIRVLRDLPTFLRSNRIASKWKFREFLIVDN